MSAEAPTVHLSLESRPQTLTMVRGMLSGIAEALAMEAELLDDLKTAVSEACNNVVLHAYGGAAGPMDVRMFVDPDRIRVTVEDRGEGLSGGETDPGSGIGLSVIRALTDVMELGPGEQGGTRIDMSFAGQRQGEPLFAAPRPAAPDGGPGSATGEEIFVSLSPVDLLATVLGRMARTLAATAHFSLDRFSDVYLITDSLAAHARREAAKARVGARLHGAERRLEIEMGPFELGSSESLASLGPNRSPLALLSDELSTVETEEGEMLRVVVLDRRQ